MVWQHPGLRLLYIDRVPFPALGPDRKRRAASERGGVIVDLAPGPFQNLHAKPICAPTHIGDDYEVDATPALPGNRCAPWRLLEDDLSRR
jgi:hypothetical protein